MSSTENMIRPHENPYPNDNMKSVPENGQVDLDDKVPKKFIILELMPLLLIFAILSSYLYFYFTANQQLNLDYSWVSVGYAAVPTDENSIVKGEHIATTRGCKDCHGGNYEGNILQDNWQGTLVAPNLTEGAGSAVKDYFDEDWVKAIKHGLGKNNKPLLIMPSSDYNSLSDSDLLCMVAYLKQLPPKNHVLPKRRLTPLTYLGVAMGKFPPISANVIDHGAASIGAIKPDTTIAFGKYLSSSCIGCHGANLKGGAGPNLTSTGEVGHWSYSDFNNAITHGKLPTGKDLKPEMPWKSFASMNETELLALYKYLKNTK